ncbi:MAG: TIGR00304 family membrane protein [Candidatus Thorarchaeota archaeon]
MRSNYESAEQQRESKGVILLGPIPIVWGYGKRGWIIAAIVAITLFLIVILWRF